MDVDREALARDLRAALEGEVRFGDGDRAIYSADGSNYRQVPIGAVVPATTDDVVAAVEVCRRHGAPVLARGGGTSLAGQCVNEAVVVDTTKRLDRILELRPEDATARVQPGVVLDDLRRAAARHGLTFGPDPATHDRCTLGGMIGNNSCGVHSLVSGRTAEQVVELDVVTYDGFRLTAGRTSDADRNRIVAAGGRRGAIYSALAALAERHAGEIRTRYPRIPRRVSGYNLDELLPEKGFDVGRALVGTEGTCVTVLEATVRLVPAPPARSLVVAGFPDIATAADHVPGILGLGPLGLEGFDDRLAGFARRKGLWDEDLALLPEGGGWLLVELGGDTAAAAEAGAAKVVRLLERSGASCVRLGEVEARRVWRLRESAAGAASFVPGGPEYWPGWEDSAVAPDRLGPYLRDLERLFGAYGYSAGLLGHFGEGCIHCRVDFGLRTEEGRRTWRRFLEEAADLVVGYGGSLSGEHGDGQARAFLLPRMFGDELLGAFRAFKSVWDPEGRMNPGKVVDALPFDEHLRLGAGHRPATPATLFGYGPGGFARAAERCVGIGACRRTAGGTMCPSYRATRDEQHSTRGRARLLFEMLEGGVVADGWRSVAVREALDLCLACKACRTECPVGVDMATYKAEFLAHHYRGRLRPRAAWSMGLFHHWSRLASMAPRLANALAGAPGVSALAKRVAGVAPQRRIPRFAPETFMRRFARGRGAGWRQEQGGPGRPVVLWPDTFGNRLHPEVLEAAAGVLVDAGFAVTVPAKPPCCGRPLYDFGMLRAARRQLRKVLHALGPAIREGVPVVVVEPGCLSVFRDELRGLLAGDSEAARLSGLAVSLAELLVREGYDPPRLAGRALVHGHCHQKALAGMTADAQLLARTGLEADLLDAGCCGMAGAFGFDRRHYEVSMQVGELALLPAVRAAPPETLLIADGVSCREQILQSTGRRAFHTAEVLAMGLASVPARRRGP
jgi:FAD/FMN-containing dehydrogenase/Fe-S oxidoreductase